MAALGAELTLVPSEGGRTTKKLILDMVEAARVLSREPHTYWTDQLNNTTASRATTRSARRPGVRQTARLMPSCTVWERRPRRAAWPPC
jgi:cysteine synthase